MSKFVLPAEQYRTLAKRQSIRYRVVFEALSDVSIAPQSESSFYPLSVPLKIFLAVNMKGSKTSLWHINLLADEAGTENDTKNVKISKVLNFKFINLKYTQ